MQGHVKVTPARWWHLPGVAQLIRESRRRRFGVEGTLVWAPRWSPSLGLLQSVWAAPMPGMPGIPGPRSFVVEQGNRAVGLGQMRPRREPRHWEVVYLAVEPESSAAGEGPRLRLIPDRRATRLVGEMCDASAQLGAERLFVRIADNDGGYEVFRQVGFTPVVREFTYYRPPSEAGAPGALPEIAGLRPQHRADAFGVLQLYHECTPKVVQMAEGKRSQSWELVGAGLGKRLGRQAGARRWVVERDARKVAWLQVNAQRRGPHQVRMMVSEQAADVLQPLLDFALQTLAGRPANGVVMRVREHQPRVMRVLEERGFEPIESQLLMVKQLAAPAMQPGFARALEKVV